MARYTPPETRPAFSATQEAIEPSEQEQVLAISDIQAGVLGVAGCGWRAGPDAEPNVIANVEAIAPSAVTKESGTSVATALLDGWAKHTTSVPGPPRRPRLTIPDRDPARAVRG